MPYQLEHKKNIAILGYGCEGESTFNFLTNQKKISPDNITILDSNKDTVVPLGAKKKLGTACFVGLDAYDLIIRSAGVSPYQLPLMQYKEDGGTLISHMSLFFSQYTGKVIGITGTKGKTTISQLTYNVLKRAEIDAILIGNGGNPSLTSINREKQPEYVVCELSSYMLEDANPSCEIAILSNLYHEHHASRHGSVQAYHHAKWNIAKNTTNMLIGSQIKEIPSFVEKYEQFGQRGQYTIQEVALYNNNQPIIKIKDIALLGEHNHYNICAVIGVCDLLGIDMKHLMDEVKKFTGVEHRLEYVGQYNHIHRYNDAIASTPESTIAALQALPSTQTLFLGGKDGGYSFDLLVETIKASSVKKIVFYPDTGRDLFPLFKETHQCYFAEKFEQGLQRANENTDQNAIALLSCGAAYTLGIPFEEKGVRFKQYVQQQ